MEYIHKYIRDMTGIYIILETIYQTILLNYFFFRNLNSLTYILMLVDINCDTFI